MEPGAHGHRTGGEQKSILHRNSVMPSKRLAIFLAISVFSCSSLMAQTAAHTAENARTLDFHAPASDPYANSIREDARKSILQVQAFFGAPFPDSIHFRLVDGRSDFDAAVKTFGLGPTQCWMVGVGTADLMVVLSPADWKKEACEHNPNDVEATRQLVKHELIHVYHGQVNPSRDFTGVDDLDWFIEGLAVYGSGQLTKDRVEHMHTAVVAGEIPHALSKIWTGPNRYGFAGSLVRYVDQEWGRPTIVRLLKARSSAEALTILGTDENVLLAGWQASLTHPEIKPNRLHNSGRQ